MARRLAPRLCPLLLVAAGAAGTLRRAAPASLRAGAAAAVPKAALQGGAARANASKGVAGATFVDFYANHVQGRGMWKWNNALAAYNRHFGPLAGHQVDIGEVGVQSGGSMLMWQSVFGEACHVYGIDINPQCLMFQDAKTTITIGNQGDPKMWDGFFTHTCQSLDVLIDDGGHEPDQMLVTLTQVFPRLSPGGFITIEDVHGQHYVQSFFAPAASYLAQEYAKGQVASVHVYPFVLLVHKAGRSTKFPNADLAFAGSSVTVDSFEQLWAHVPMQKGGTVILENAGWGPFITQQGLINFFTYFGSLHDSKWTDIPAGCAHTAAAVCTNQVTNSPMQSLITGVHIYPTYLVVEVAAAEPSIQAVRRGTEFLTY